MERRRGEMLKDAEAAGKAGLVDGSSAGTRALVTWTGLIRDWRGGRQRYNLYYNRHVAARHIVRLSQPANARLDEKPTACTLLITQATAPTTR